jgi:2-methylisocitrate lyase-like PEP mutase family enzyme
MGYGIVLYANAALQGAVKGMTAALETLRRTGRLDEDSGLVATFAQRQQLVQKDLFDELGDRYRS